jgi:hypothetical protein
LSRRYVFWNQDRDIKLWRSIACEQIPSNSQILKINREGRGVQRLSGMRPFIQGPGRTVG